MSLETGRRGAQPVRRDHENSREQECDAQHEGCRERAGERRERTAEQWEGRASCAEQCLVQARGSTSTVGAIEALVQRGMVRQTRRYPQRKRKHDSQRQFMCEQEKHQRHCRRAQRKQKGAAFRSRLGDRDKSEGDRLNQKDRPEEDPERGRTGAEIDADRPFKPGFRLSPSRRSSSSCPQSFACAWS